MFSSILRKLIFLVILIPLFYLPGILAYAEAGSKAAIFFLLASLIFFLFSFLFLFEERSLKISPIIWIAGIYMAILSLSTFFSFDKTLSFWGGARDMNGLLLYLCLFGFLLVLSGILKKEEDWEKILLLSIGAGAVVSLVAYLQVFDVLSLSGKGSFMGNTSFMGTYLIFNVFFSVYLFSKKKNFLYIASALFMIFPMYLFNSRAALVGTLVGFFLLGLFYLAFKTEKEKIKRIGKVFLMVIIFGFLFVSFLVFHPIEDGIFKGPVGEVESYSRNSFYEAGDGMRYIFWQQSFQGFKERPLLGWGLNNFRHIYFKNFNPEILIDRKNKNVWSGNPHNVVYEKLSENGILGLLAHLILLMAGPFLLWKSYRKKEISFWAPAIFTAMMTAYFIQQLTIYDTYNNLILLFLFFGFVNFYSFGKTIQMRGIVKLKLSPWLLMFSVIACGFIFYNGFYKPIRVNYFLIDALWENDPQKRIDISREVIQLADFDKANTQLVLAQETRSYLYNNQLTQDDLNDLVNFHIKELEKESLRLPDWQILAEKAQYYIINKEYEKAENVLRKAQELSPRNPQSLWTLAQVQVEKGEFKEAKETIQKFIEIEPRIKKFQEIANQLILEIEKIENKK